MHCRQFSRGQYVYVKDGLFKGEHGRIIEVLQECHFYKLVVDGGQVACVKTDEIETIERD